MLCVFQQTIEPEAHACLIWPSGEGVVIEGATFATGHTVIHWLTPAPRGSIAFFDAFDDFLKIHIKPHPTNKTIITFEDGEQTIYDGG